MPDKPQDRDLSQIYRSTAPESSPRELDERILAEASLRAPEKRQRLPAWLPVASAVGVVGLTMTLLYQTEQVEEHFYLVPRDEATVAPEARRARSAPALEVQREEAMEADAAAKTQFQEQSVIPARRAELVRDEMPVKRAATVVEDAPAASGLAAPMADMEAAADAVAATLEERKPAEWLDSIRELLKQGERAQAREELTAFVEAFPEHPLPEELETLLETD